MTLQTNQRHLLGSRVFGKRRTQRIKIPLAGIELATRGTFIQLCVTTWASISRTWWQSYLCNHPIFPICSSRNSNQGNRVQLILEFSYRNITFKTLLYMFSILLNSLWGRCYKRYIVRPELHGPDVDEVEALHGDNHDAVGKLDPVRMPDLIRKGFECPTQEQQDHQQLILNCLPRRCSSVGIASFKGPSLVQLYWRGFETLRSIRVREKS